MVVEEPGRHYIRVRARGKRDESQYALRLMFHGGEGGGKCRCHECQAGEQRCLGKDAYILCAKRSATCNAWDQVFSCPSGCRAGRCTGCSDECTLGSRRCAEGGYQVCRRSENGCASWSARAACGRGKHCRGGRCLRAGRATRPAPQPERPQAARGKIISIYTYRGRMTLHIEIGDNPEIKAGMSGVVIEAATGNALRDGGIKITRIAGRYAIATTKLTELGKNRDVRIFLR